MAAGSSTRNGQTGCSAAAPATINARSSACGNQAGCSAAASTAPAASGAADTGDSEAGSATTAAACSTAACGCIQAIAAACSRETGLSARQDNGAGERPADVQIRTDVSRPVGPRHAPTTVATDPCGPVIR
jgi:hypothetical protein